MGKEEGYRINLKGDKEEKTMSVAKEYGGILFGFVLWTLLAVVFLTVAGCDETRNMTNGVITQPTEPTDPTTNGEVKQPDDEKPTEPTEPQEPEPQPTVTIGSATQGDDGSITVSGISANLPEGTNIAVTLGDGTVRAYGRTDAEGKWTATIPPEKAKDLPDGTVAIAAAATGVAPDTSSIAYTPPPQPTVTISEAKQNDDGSITVSGVSANLPEGTTVTVTLGDSITATATTDTAGVWTVTVPIKKAKNLGAGTASVTATATNTPASTDTVKYMPLTREEEIAQEVAQKYAEYNFSEEVVQRLVERHVEGEKNGLAYLNGDISAEEWVRRDLLSYEKVYGISGNDAYELLKIYIEENPDKEYLFGGWSRGDIALAYLIIKRDNPDATWEEVKELFRQGSQDGSITISN